LAKRQTLAPKLDKARLLALLAENPGATKRDLARLTGLKGSDRILLKRLLKELEKEGAIAGRTKSGFAKHGELPEMTVIEITGADSDGELLARPLNWDSDDEPPAIHVMPDKEGRALAAGAASWRGWNGAAKAMMPGWCAGWKTRPDRNAFWAC
jgi:ribonuclease R